MRLPSNVIQICFASTETDDATDPCDFAVLSSEEQQRASRFRVRKDRAAYILGKYMVRTLLGQVLGLSPQSIEFKFGENGKPALVLNDFRPEVAFNLAHSGTQVACALGVGRSIGIDVEFEKGDIDFLELAKNSFCPDEINCILNSSPDEAKRLFYKYWTIKEAYLKAEGSGISADLAEINASQYPDVFPGPVLNLKDETTPGIRVQRLALCSGYAAAVAANGGVWTSKCYLWPLEKDSLAL
jgi:4'-phosphopantetheinyl transferase